MAITDVQGLDILYQAISETLEIEKCSICLERLKSTVLLWPCTHWFCNNCISNLQKSAHGGRVKCPLCKSATSRRKVLHFQDKQKEYEDHLQTLIGALSLDLKFDVTSYNNVRNCMNSANFHILEDKKKIKVSSPVRKTRARPSVRVIEVKQKTGIQETTKNTTRRSGKQQLKCANLDLVEPKKVQHNELLKGSTILSVDTTNDSFTEQKVKEWLDCNKFSQADQIKYTETIIADVHKAELDESACLSEIHLQSVSQGGFKSKQTPIRRISTKNMVDTSSDIEAIKPLDESCGNVFPKKRDICKKLNTISLPAIEKFDELFPEGKKLQIITTTYGSKNPYTSTRKKSQRFTVNLDVFNNTEEIKEKDRVPSSEKYLEESKETIEDFSSGSGEEWTIEKKSRKWKLGDKSNSLKRCIKQTLPKKSIDSIKKCLRKNPVGTTLRRSKKYIPKLSNINVESDCNNSKEDVNKKKIKYVANKEYQKYKENVVKEIIDDWNDTKDSNNLMLSKSQVHMKSGDDLLESKSNMSPPVLKDISLGLHENKPADQNVPLSLNTPSKDNTRSPGWSRLKSSKKEFHLSEKKKLSLKTFNKSKSSSSFTSIGISPLCNQSQISTDSRNQINHVQSATNACQPIAITPEDKLNLLKNDSTDKSSEKVNGNLAINKQTFPELQINVNASLISSISSPPFIGFPTPLKKESFQSVISSTDNINETDQKEGSSLSLICPRKNNEASKYHKVLGIGQSVLSKGELMEVDTEGTPRSINHKKDGNKKLLSSLKIFEESCKTPEIFRAGDKINAKDICQEETKECLVFSKKRDRDSGIHNESGICSPVKKKVCIDAEVQTSPGRMHSVIRDMLKEMSSSELEDIIMQSKKRDLQKNLSFVNETNFECFTNRLSQNSDKENVEIPIKSQNSYKKCSDDSDIVLGTEDCISHTQLNTKHCLGDKNIILRDQYLAEHNLLLGQSILDDNDVGPDAPTQRYYKTPITVKQPLQTSTKEYTVVSNPTNSELKRVNSMFDNSDVIFPDDTPKGVTPWNYSGVSQLEGNTGTVKKHADVRNILPLSQNKKEKANRSRRQLDFLEENSNDMFEFERQSCDKSRQENKNYKGSCLNYDKTESLNRKISEGNDGFMESNGQNESVNSSKKVEPAVSEIKDVTQKKSEEINPEIGVVSENLSDTPGIVWPSEVQCLENRMENCVKAVNDTSDCTKNITKNKPLMCLDLANDKIDTIVIPRRPSKSPECKNIKSSSLHQLSSPLMFNECSTGQKPATTSDTNMGVDDDGESNVSSDDCFIEGTQDVSQIKEVQRDIVDVEGKTKETGANKYQINLGKSPQALSETTVIEQLSSDCFSKANKDTHIESEQKEAVIVMINNEEASSHKTVENSEIEDENICFASSLLNPQQNQVLACVLNGMGLSYSKTVGPHISHLIVGTKNGCFQNTYKVLHAMALHKPIIRFDWVEEVVRTGGTVPLDPFVALDPSGECGVIRAKADKNRELLKSFAVHIYNVDDRVIQKEQIENLVELCGGTVVKELHHFHNVPRDKFRIIVLSEPPDTLTQGDWRQKYSAVEVMIDWVYNTVGRYRVMPVVSFMVTDPADAVSFLQHEGYPEELIFDVSAHD